MTIAVNAGAFDPLSNGHLSIIRAAAQIFAVLNEDEHGE
jgi:phosphopantetheine adenylyltransferase